MNEKALSIAHNCEISLQITINLLNTLQINQFIYKSKHFRIVYHLNFILLLLLNYFYFYFTFFENFYFNCFYCLLKQIIFSTFLFKFYFKFQKQSHHYNKKIRIQYNCCFFVIELRINRLDF